jgi:alkanesulfonate monooxygenase SsuD/methylene tetrahydromethanopterin reductase-like flavin-dependent oxidoreductase (luciferase family)
LPISLAQSPLAEAQPATSSQHHSHRQVSGVLGDHRCIADGDAPRCGSRQVDIVSTRRNIGDQPELGLRAKMLEMAAEVGDGVIINLWPQGALPQMLEHVKIGAQRAGKNWEDIEIVNRAMVLVTDDKALGRKIFRMSFGPYYATPVYNKYLAWAGYEDAAAAIREGWAEKDRDKTAAAMNDEMVDEIAVIGTVKEVQDRIRTDAHAGVHTQIIAPMAVTPEDALRTFKAFTPANFSF